MKANRLKYIVLSLLFIVGVVNVYAQGQLKGVVVDEQNSPIAGATILFEGTNVGTTTDMNGKFQVVIPAKSTGEITISYIGFETQTVKVGKATELNITLKEEVASFEEVVVVGYGTMRKSDLTGSVASVSIDEEEASRSTSLDQLLSGRVTGVRVTAGSAAPGGAANIVIRGASSLNNSSEPLYVIDGVIMGDGTDDTSSAFRGGDTDSSQETQSGLSMVSPSDIASIEVLKDASATAIYGSQGANGVILITTKTGTSSKPTISFSHSTELAQASKKFDVLNFEEFLDYVDATGAVIETLEGKEEIDWQDYALRTAVSNISRVSISGRNKGGGSYYVSAGRSDGQGVIKQTYAKQTDFRTNYTTKLHDNVTFTTNNSLAQIRNSMTQGTSAGSGSGAAFTSIVRQMINSRPYYTAEYDELLDDETSIGINRYFEDAEDLSTEYKVVSSNSISIKLPYNLSWRSSLGLSYRNKERLRYDGPLMVSSNSTYESRVGSAELYVLNYNSDHQLNYNGEFGKHRISAMLGFSMNRNTQESRTLYATNMTDNSWRENGYNLAGTTADVSYTYTQSSLLSYFTRGTYNYDDRYLVTATFRADGSSKFSEENRFGYFPSFAFAWRANQEQFLQNVDWLSNLKFRAGWGQVGSQAVAAYQTQLLYGSANIPTYDDELGAGYTSGAAQNVAVNEDLKWETTEQINLGLDFGFLSGRLNFTVDVYDKLTKDLLLKVETPLSASVGYDSNLVNNRWINQGAISNRGIEFAIDAVPVKTKNFTWSVSANISFNKNEIQSLDLDLADYGVYKNVSAFLGNPISSSVYLTSAANIFMEGYPVGVFFGYETDGIITSEEENLYTYKGETMEVGMRKYVNNDDSDTDINDSDRVIIGDPNPDFTGGFATTFAYKRISLSAQFTGSYGNDIINGNNAINWQTGGFSGNSRSNVLSEAYYGAWDAETNPDGTFPSLGLEPLSRVSSVSDFLVEDGSYLRLSSVTLAYDFNVSSLSCFKTLSLSVTGRNLWLLTSYSGYDPEVNSFAYDSLRQGIDYGSYPTSKALIFGLSATF